MDILLTLEEDAILCKYGEEAGGEILRLQREITLLREGKNHPPYWRDRYFSLYDQLSKIADLVGASRSSDYEGGHVLNAVDQKINLSTWTVQNWKTYFTQHPEVAENMAMADRSIYYDWLDRQQPSTLPSVGEIEHDVGEEPDTGE